MLVCLLFVAAPASAEQIWHAPVDIVVGGSISNEHVALGPQGDAVAIWINGVTSGIGAHLPLGAVYAAARSAGGAWQAPVVISAGAEATSADLAVDGQGNAVAVWGVYAGGVHIAVRPVGGAWQTPVEISGPRLYDLFSTPQVAVNAAGDIIAVWTRYSSSQTVVESAVRRAGAGWQSPVVVSAASGRATSPDIALDQAGNAVAIWDHDNPDGSPQPLKSAVRTAGGAWQGPVDIPGSAAGGRLVGGARLAVDAQGNAVALWSRRESATGPAFVQGAARPAGGEWQPFALATASAGVYDVDVAVNGRGDAVAAWTRGAGQAGVVQSAMRPLGGAWQPPVDISAAAASGVDVEIDEQSNTVAVWRRIGPNATSVVQGAVRRADGGWQAPVDVSAAGRDVWRAQVAVDPRGDAIAMWFASGLHGASYDSSPASPPPPPPPPTPTVTGLRLSPSTFRAARSGPSVLPASARVGSRVRYALNTSASVRFTVARSRGGRRVGGRDDEEQPRARELHAICAPPRQLLPPATGGQRPLHLQRPRRRPHAAAGGLQARRDPGRREHRHTGGGAFPGRTLNVYRYAFRLERSNEPASEAILMRDQQAASHALPALRRRLLASISVRGGFESHSVAAPGLGGEAPRGLALSFDFRERVTSVFYVWRRGPVPCVGFRSRCVGRFDHRRTLQIARKLAGRVAG